MAEYLTLDSSSSINKLPAEYEELWRKNSIVGDTLTLSHKQSLNPSWDPSSLHPSPLFPNPANQENFAGCMTSPTCTSPPQIRYHLIIQPSMCMIFPAHGEPFQLYLSSFFTYHQDPKLPFEMLWKHIGPYLLITASGQVWSYIFEKMTALQQTSATISDSPQQEGPTTELAHHQNELIIIYSLGFLAATLTHTTASAVPGCV